MRYQVPQFIAVEDRIFGPLTVKQFLYVAGGAALGFILWSVLPKIIALFVVIPVVVFFLALAFYKFNDRPLIHAVESGIKFFMGTRLYIWHKKEKKPTAKKPEEQKDPNSTLGVPKLSDSKLKDLSWSLDINEKVKEEEKV